VQVTCITCTKELMSKYRTRADLVKQFNEDYAEMRKNAKLRDYGLLNQAWNDMCDAWRKSGLVDPASPGYTRGWTQPQWVVNAPKKEWRIDRNTKAIRVVQGAKTILSIVGKEASLIFDSCPKGIDLMKHIRAEIKKRGVK
jgi:hypothetical protein